MTHSAAAWGAWDGGGWRDRGSVIAPPFWLVSRARMLRGFGSAPPPTSSLSLSPLPLAISIGACTAGGISTRCEKGGQGASRTRVLERSFAGSAVSGLQLVNQVELA